MKGDRSESYYWYLPCRILLNFPPQREVGVTRRDNGFTLIELLVVVAIIGIIAAIAIPNMLVAIQRAKQRRTMVDIRNIATAWESRNTEAGRYNAAGSAPNGVEGADQQIPIDSLEAMLSPTYMKHLPKIDGWGTPYQAFTDQAYGGSGIARVYAIISAGKDLVVDSDPAHGAITNFDCDIVYSNGVFLSYPDGVTLSN